MDEGMLWFDNSDSTLNAKIERAVAYYREKYGQEPNLCLVNPGALSTDTDAPSITVRPYRPVLPGHLWIGREDKTLPHAVKENENE